MIEQTTLDTLREAGLFPHQARFILDFLAPNSPVHSWLIAPTGTGRSGTIAVLVNRLIIENQARHILILTDRTVLQMNFFQALKECVHTLPVVAVDKRVFREREAEAQVGNSPWNSSIVAVMTTQLAKQADIANSLLTVKWDLVIVDEAHRLGQQASLIEKMVTAESVNRLLFLTTFLPERGLLASETPTKEWTLETLVDWEGHRLFLPFELVRITYERSSDEIVFLSKLQDFIQQSFEGSMSNVQKSLLLRLASSSLYAIEQSLLRLHTQLLQRQVLEESPIDTPVDEYEEEPAIHISEMDCGNTLSSLEDLLESLSEIPEDTKRQALLELLDKLKRDQPNHRICIFSYFSSTVAYLYTTLREKDANIFQVTGSLSYEERARELAQFNQTGGILVATSVILGGFILAPADVVINYDLSMDLENMVQRQAALVHRGHTTRHVSYVFVDETGIFSWEKKALELYGFKSAPAE